MLNSELNINEDKYLSLTMRTDAQISVIISQNKQGTSTYL